MRDLAVTWPQSKSLEAYLAELEAAVGNRLQINFRVPSKPRILPERCYMVHSGFVRGYNCVLAVEYRGEREVARVESDAFAGFWPAGWYVVRNPEWHPLVEPIPMRGFQGYRYIERPAGPEVPAGSSDAS